MASGPSLYDSRDKRQFCCACEIGPVVVPRPGGQQRSDREIAPLKPAERGEKATLVPDRVPRTRTGGGALQGPRPCLPMAWRCRAAARYGLCGRPLADVSLAITPATLGGCAHDGGLEFAFGMEVALLGNCCSGQMVGCRRSGMAATGFPAELAQGAKAREKPWCTEAVRYILCAIVTVGTVASAAARRSALAKSVSACGITANKCSSGTDELIWRPGGLHKPVSIMRTYRSA